MDTLCIWQGSCQHVTICIHHTHSSCIHCDTLSVKADTLYPGMVGILRVPIPLDMVSTGSEYQAMESVANRGRAGALWAIAISSTYAICPYSPQSPQCMALYIVVCNAGNAVYGSSLRASSWHAWCNSTRYERNNNPGGQHGFPAHEVSVARKACWQQSLPSLWL